MHLSLTTFPTCVPRASAETEGLAAAGLGAPLTGFSEDLLEVFRGGAISQFFS